MTVLVLKKQGFRQLGLVMQLVLRVHGRTLTPTYKAFQILHELIMT